MGFDSKCDFAPPISYCGFSFALACVVSFFGGVQHSPVNGCSAASCNFGVLVGEDERMSFDSATRVGGNTFCCSKSPCFGHFEVNTALSVFSPLLPALGHSIFPWCTVLLLLRMLLACSYLCAGGGGVHQSTNCGLPLCKNHKTGCWERQSHASSYIYIYVYIYIYK